MALISVPTCPNRSQFPTHSVPYCQIFFKRCNGLSSTVRFLVSSESKAEEKEEKRVIRCSPFLEKALLANSGVPASDEWTTVPDIWRTSAEKYGDRVALVDPYHDPPTNMTYIQLEQEILHFAEGLRVIGLNPNEKLALFADNSCRWLVADQGIMAAGAINVVRGLRSSVEELLHIYNHSECEAIVVDSPEFFNRISVTFSSKAAIKFVILLWGNKEHLSTERMDGIPIFEYKEIVESGKESRKALFVDNDARNHTVYEKISSDDIATLVYTSGTTGDPKGVMLTHKNLLHQICNLWDVVPAEPGDRFLSMLPPWHMYERACEYFIMTLGVEQVYTTIRNLKEDLRDYQPQYIIAVPLIYETLYRSSSVRRIIVVLTLPRIKLYSVI